MRRRGFSLLELVVAIAVLTVGMLGVLRAVSQGINASRAAADRTLGVELAEQKLTELVVNPELEPGVEAGDFGELQPRFGWESTVEETELSGLFRVRVTVTWTSGAQEHSVDLETCYAPQALVDDTAAAAEQAGGPAVGAVN